MKKLAILIMVFAMAPVLAKIAGEFGFYILLAFAALGLICFLSRDNKRNTQVPHAPDIRGQSKFRRAVNAMKDVRKGKMTLAQASKHYGVTEKTIKRVHYFDYLITHH